jgi:hypothetical protein
MSFEKRLNQILESMWDTDDPLPDSDQFENEVDGIMQNAEQLAEWANRNYAYFGNAYGGQIISHGSWRDLAKEFMPYEGDPMPFPGIYVPRFELDGQYDIPKKDPIDYTASVLSWSNVMSIKSDRELGWHISFGVRTFNEEPAYYAVVPTEKGAVEPNGRWHASAWEAKRIA